MKPSVSARTTWLVLFITAMVQLCAAAATADRPNIVILFADDLGYGDLSSYGCPDIRTPNIDAIGKRGVRFTQFYSNSAQCTPSRAALLTGRYQQRIGGLECAIGNGNIGRYDEAEWLQKRGELGMPAAETTIAAMLRRSGYETAIIGKWHLGYERKFWPDNPDYGFDESFGILGGGADYVSHKEAVTGHQVLVHNGKHTEAKGYLTDVIADRAIEWITKRRQPYFLYVPFNAPHDPIQGPDDPAGTDSRDRAVYRKMVEHLDKRIGDILAAVARTSAAENTILVFLSDNGGTGLGRNAPFRGGKSTLWEGGIRVPCLLAWPRRIASGKETDQVALNIDLTATLLAAAGVTPPPDRRLDGVSILDVLTGAKATFPRAVFWRYKRAETRKKAVRDGDLKFVIDDGNESLFDLAADRSETRNLVGALPEKAAALRAKLATWENEVVAQRLKEFRPATGK